MDDPHRHDHDHDHPPPGWSMGGGAECLACPICVILQALSSARPEVMAHLLAASRELTLAFQALVDAQADAARAAATRAGGRVTRIRVD